MCPAPQHPAHEKKIWLFYEVDDDCGNDCGECAAFAVHGALHLEWMHRRQKFATSALVTSFIVRQVLEAAANGKFSVPSPAPTTWQQPTAIVFPE